jgi:hypothetical protein
MAKYFNYFPTTLYFLEDGKTSLDVVTNLTSKFKFDSNFKENSIVYYEYTVSDGETPEVISDKLYGSPEKHWIILALNDIVHPQLDWPLEQKSLISFIDKKYKERANTANGQTGINWAQSNYKEHFVTETITVTTTGSSTISINQITEQVYANTTDTTESYTIFANTVVEVSKIKSRKTYFDYEIDNNESKRSIKILKNEFVSRVEEEFRNLL